MTRSLADEVNALIAAERFAEALDAMKGFGDPAGRGDLLQNIGVCHYRLGDHATALRHLRAAHQADPANAATIANIALISSEVGPAEVVAGATLTPNTINDLGLNAYFRGGFAEARQWLERAIQAKPDYFAAYHNLADLIEPEETADWLKKAEALRPEAPADRASLSYFQAHLFDQIGEHAEAIKAWAIGAEARRETFDRPFNADGHKALVDRVIDTFSTETLRRLQTGSEDQRSFTFIVGLPRSGSTLTARLLAGDPKVADLGERRALATAVIARLNAYGGDHGAGFQRLMAVDARQIFADYVADLPSTGAFLDKYLENFMFLGLIWAAFPNARIIHTVRDRFDCLFSCYTKNFTMGNEWTYRPEDLAAYAAQCDRLMAHWAEVLPPRILITSEYETMTQDPDGVLLRLAAHTGLDAKAASTTGHAAGGVVKTASAKQVRRAVKPRTTSPYEAYKPLISF